MLLCADAAAASADLAGGMLACPSCRAGRLKRWGYGRERAVRLLGGATARLRPQRARCGSCRRTQVLLPSWCAPRRADAIEVIGTAAGMALAGAGYGRIGAGLGVPAATVRGWLRLLRCRAEAMRQDAMHQLGFAGGLADPPLPGPAGSPLGDALNAVAALRARRQHPVRPVPGGPVAAAGPVRPGPPSRARPRLLILPASPGTGTPAGPP